MEEDEIFSKKFLPVTPIGYRGFHLKQCDTDLADYLETVLKESKTFKVPYNASIKRDGYMIKDPYSNFDNKTREKLRETRWVFPGTEKRVVVLLHHGFPQSRPVCLDLMFHQKLLSFNMLQILFAISRAYSMILRERNNKDKKFNTRSLNLTGSIITALKITNYQDIRYYLTPVIEKG